MIPKEYASFLAQKEVSVPAIGMGTIPTLNSAMKPHQLVLTEFALRMGSSAGFVDTGLGKSLVELEWGRCVSEYTKLPVLLLTPLAVAGQMKREADRFGIEARIVKHETDVGDGVNITNYDRVNEFSAFFFGGIALDESSILKGCTSKTLWTLIDMWKTTPFRYAATATPAPNDHTELGNHAHFLGVMRMQEMLMRWFLHDSGHTQDWRLKHHAVKPFWSWVGSWARCMTKPSDFGFSDDGYDLPPLRLIKHVVDVDRQEGRGENLFRIPATSATEIHAEKRRTITARAKMAAELVMGQRDEAWVVWCDTDYEADALKKAIPSAIEVRGGMTMEKKEQNLLAFSNGDERVIITKPTIAGFGLNWQHCSHQCFAGISYSWERFYQAVRRSWRFGQTREVFAHCILAETEENLWQTLREKEASNVEMKEQMALAMNRVQGGPVGVRESLNLNHRGRMPAFI